MCFCKSRWLFVDGRNTLPLITEESQICAGDTQCSLTLRDVVACVAQSAPECVQQDCGEVIHTTWESPTEKSQTHDVLELALVFGCFILRNPCGLPNFLQLLTRS